MRLGMLPVVVIPKVETLEGGDKEQIRSTLERLFQGVAKSAKVRIDS